MLNIMLNTFQSESFHSLNNFSLNAYHLLDNVLVSRNGTVKKTAKFFPSWNEYPSESLPSPSI